MYGRFGNIFLGRYGVPDNSAVNRPLFERKRDRCTLQNGLAGQWG
jgi:hypothetical protein